MKTKTKKIKIIKGKNFKKSKKYKNSNGTYKNVLVNKNPV